MLFFLSSLASAGSDPEIREHLLHVVSTLRAETPSDLPVDVRVRRLAALEALESYAWAGDFPDSRGGPERVRAVHPPRAFWSGIDAARAPRFVDPSGTHCAVGYLMGIDSPGLVERIDAAHEWDWIPEMDDPAVVSAVGAWAGEHGFTVDELAWIQPGYAVEVATCPVGGEQVTSYESCGLLMTRGEPCNTTCGGDIHYLFEVQNTGAEPVTYRVFHVAAGVEREVTLAPGEVEDLSFVVAPDQGGFVGVDVDGCIAGVAYGGELPPIEATCEQPPDPVVTPEAGCSTAGGARWTLGAWISRR
ncbi:MAG: hypothetical protein KC656_18425 [Myxococcales bacterium]|nr:hypothetical protein [Myxococcales bacterium]MCB9672123.1 hypothetical protein [Alphaproteobacteria bacterium]MCB9691576.1 hypothetical protein [Alphaproteobacteria bacterium]